MTIGQKIFTLRSEKGLSQEELADIIGVSRHTIGKWENDVMNPNAENISKICDIFGVDANYLISEDYSHDSAITSDDKNSFQDKRKNKSLTFKIIVITLLVFCAIGSLIGDVFLGILVLTPSKGAAVANSSAPLYKLMRVEIFLNNESLGLTLFSIALIFTVAIIVALVAFLVKRKSGKLDLK